MNWEHLKAFVWLRSRLLVNQWRRAGTVNAVLMSIVAVGAIVTAVPLFIGVFALGVYAIPKAAPVHLLYVWDGVIVAFLFFWAIGLITELQRSEPLALSKFLHLPVSVNSAFLINYISSLLRLSLIVFVPVMLAYALALVVAKGASMLPVLLLLAAFLLMITALTYQFQGWLGSLMTNPRRRRTVVVVTTMLFVLVFQLPNLVNIYTPRWAQQKVAQSKQLADELAKVQHAVQTGEIDPREFGRRQQEVMERHRLAVQQADRETADRVAGVARIVNIVLPVGWLPLATMSAAEGRFMPAVLGLLGMTLIGAASLRQAYRTTIRQYQGQSTARKPRQAPAAGTPKHVDTRTVRPLETRLPGLSEPASAVALGGLRSLLRAPEAKMMLLTPVIMIFIFGSMVFGQRHAIPVSVRPMLAIAAMLFVLFGVLQLMANQFGFDRDGFRVFVLSPVPRRDILLGKNLAFAPLTLGIAGALLLIVQALCPMRVDHFLAMFPQYISMFLAFCILVNLGSIYAPLPIAAGTLKPASPKLSTVLLQLLMFMVLFPIVEGATLLPLGIEAVLGALGWGAGIPICLLLTVVELAVMVMLYRVSLQWLGDLFQAREQRILEVVTGRAS
ncbi:MAG: ABC transporter permease [Isosphaeraceae bacterium]|nr:ABC transporter permease [Isosphaeraceae bacterium]